ncbi:MAG: ABC transporter permease [Alphaproteobacteria bacterium]|jgi:D-methionine transport system permease protein|nr:ABC transporter permease [Alphaproteobacteria bacterium]MBP7729438.1 ABC transporter permease [Alphaproteobacteria bacterium]
MEQLVINSLMETLMMVGISMVLGTAIGALFACLLVLTKPSGLLPKPFIFNLLGIILNAFRSIPFIILIIVMIPFTRFWVGTSIGTAAATLPLTFAASLLIARIIEDALNTIPKGLIEVGIALGISNLQIILQIQFREALPLIISGLTTVSINIIGFSAMAGTIGGGGLGDLALRYGYQRYDFTLLILIVIILIVMVQCVQMLGDFLSAFLKK